jgi:hypothetical protein
MQRVADAEPKLNPNSEGTRSLKYPSSLGRASVDRNADDCSHWCASRSPTPSQPHYGARARGPSGNSTDTGGSPPRGSIPGFNIKGIQAGTERARSRVFFRFLSSILFIKMMKTIRFSFQ